MAEQVTEDDLELLGDLGIDTSAGAAGGRSNRELRILAGFQEIVQFVEDNKHLPRHGVEYPIFERLYAVRLQRMRACTECRSVLIELDALGLLGANKDGSDYLSVGEDKPDRDADLLEALGIGVGDSEDILDLKHVRPREIQTADEVAQRIPCADFGAFKGLFKQIQSDLADGTRKTLEFRDNAEIEKGDFFILEGQKLYVAELGPKFTNHYGKVDRRLRVIFDNGIESALLLRSLQRALNKDKTSRRITDPSLGPLFSKETTPDDASSGWIYVLKSRSNHPFIAQNRDVIHKIGVTGESVERRIAGAKNDPTFLLADVEIVQTYQLANLSRTRLEHLLHRFFENARLDLELQDRFGLGVEPKEWFLIPLPVIEEAIERILDGSILDCAYDPTRGIIIHQ
jgi:hypothetical protein